VSTVYLSAVLSLLAIGGVVGAAALAFVRRVDDQASDSTLRSLRTELRALRAARALDQVAWQARQDMQRVADVEAEREERRK
jgi:hypothetical protein